MTRGAAILGDVMKAERGSAIDSSIGELSRRLIRSSARLAGIYSADESRRDEKSKHSARGQPSRGLVDPDATRLYQPATSYGDGVSIPCSISWTVGRSKM